MIFAVLNGKTVARIYKDGSNWVFAKSLGGAVRFTTQKEAKEEAVKHFGAQVEFARY